MHSFMGIQASYRGAARLLDFGPRPLGLEMVLRIWNELPLQEKPPVTSRVSTSTGDDETGRSIRDIEPALTSDAAKNASIPAMGVFLGVVTRIVLA